MTGPKELWLQLNAGRFRALAWQGSGRSAIFLHGLTGVTEVWGPTIEALGPGRPNCLAIDQRGHGQSPKPAAGYHVADFVGDLVSLVERQDLTQPDLVGHSMGARVAMVAAARLPDLFRSLAIVDIGPEQWKANHVDTVRALSRMPASYPDLESALGRASAARGPNSIDRALSDRSLTADALRAIAIARLAIAPDGTVSQRADRAALVQTVVAHRSRGYWREWERIAIPALFVRGGTSTEVRGRVAEEMRRRNPRVRYHELPGVGHNIPLLAPGALAGLLAEFWVSLPG